MSAERPFLKTEPTGPFKYSATPGFDEIHILWISEGMSCDGDSVSVTNGASPGSIEDVVLGLVPQIPERVRAELSAPVRAAVDAAVPLIRDLVDDLLAPSAPLTQGGPP